MNSYVVSREKLATEEAKPSLDKKVVTLLSFVPSSDVRLMSRPPEGRARRVLGSSTTSSSTNNIRSPTLSSSKPIRARVDLSSLASPPTSPSLNSSQTSSWTPSQPIRLKAKSTVGIRSAPTTPTVQSNGTFKSTPTNGYFRAALSPQTPAGGVGGGGTRAISPQQRARSPEVNTARTRTTSSRGVTVGAAPTGGDLRGQRDPFPSSSSNNSPNSTVVAPSPITHLPSSVSVRRLHSPSLRASQRREQEQQQQQFLSTSTSTNASSSSASSSVLPPLSSSPSSIASSPLTSPNLHSLYDSTPSNLSPRLPHSTTSTGLGFYGQASSTGRKSGSSSNGSSIRRTSGISSLSSSSIDSNSNTPTGKNQNREGNGTGLLPPFPNYSSTSLASQSAFPSPSFPSHPSFSNVSPNPHSNPILRSPTLPSSASTKTLKSVPTTSSIYPERPPIRSRTVTSSSNGSASVSIPFPSSTGAVSTTSATLDSPHSQYSRPRVDQVEWDNVERNKGGPNGNGVDLSTSPRLISTSPTRASGIVGNGMESLMRESIEKEIEAKVSRRIMDLEIRTSSLLSINAQLERQKLKQTSEIRELRRKLRESIGGVGIRRFDVDEGRSSSGGEFSDADELDEEDEDEDGEVQPSWEELLHSDPSFGQVATLVEGLIKRGKKAVEYKVEEKEKGRVLTTVEMEDRLEAREEEEEEEAQSGSEGSVE
ncbi:hypothetical protein JCM3765_007444 [Sporobolomyces pararoseus]